MSLFNKSGCELIYLAGSFALALAQGLDCDDINLLAAFLTAVGDNLAILGTQCASNEETDDCNNNHQL